MKQISNETFSSERALYGVSGITVRDCRFEGDEDGESALKESKNIKVSSCTFKLRYPLWHSSKFKMTDCEMTETCRAPIWYSRGGTIDSCRINSPKALRECDKIKITDSKIISSEFGWRCRDITVLRSHLESEYIFFENRDLTLDNITLKGKYSFQYVKNLRITDSRLDTKDSFWHAKNVTVEDSVIKGEYLGWYSDGLTLKNCKIIGTQPFCYCTNLTLENCELEDCDLAFEYSDVNADVHGHIISIKNPKSGRIVVDSVGEIIKGDAVYKCDCEIILRQ